MAQPIIEVRGVSKRYRLGRLGASSLRQEFEQLLGGRSRADDAPSDFWALKDVSFDVAPGEVLGVIGANGAGKSTLLKLLSRVTAPSLGEIRLRGRVASLLEVGTGFHPELTGRENVFLNGAILGMTRAEIRQKFDQIVDFSGVETFLDTPVKRYSSGMYVRLAFAVAAHLEPDILIVDEVLAVGDAEFQKKCLGKMRSVSSSEGRTVIFVSHNLAAIQTLCDRAINLTAGEVTFEGRAADAIAAYAGSAAPERTAWRADCQSSSAAPHFTKVWVELDGEQPAHRLRIFAEIHASRPAPDVMIAVDVLDHNGAPVMQILPSTEPFIAFPGPRRVRIDVDLPPLIPGAYSLDFWLGTHFTRTVAHLAKPISFAIADSPTPGRVFPHHPDHGHMAPSCTAELEQ